MPDTKIKIISDSAKVTKQLAYEFIREVVKKSKGPHIFLLKGDLGIGKTTFTLGLLSYFSIRPHAASPTFVLMKRYVPRLSLRAKQGSRASLHYPAKRGNLVRNIYHIDAYRLRSKKNLNDLFGGHSPFSKTPLKVRGERGGMTSFSDSLFIIEWPDMVRLAPPKGAFVVTFRHGSHPNERHIQITRK